MKRYLLLITNLFLSFHVLAQSPATLSGRITDEQAEPVPGTSIVLKQIMKGTSADTDGRYEIKNIAPGHYTLSISGIGYIIQTKEIEMKAGQQLKLDVVLLEDVTEMQEVVIQTESEGQVLELSAKSVQVIDTREVKIKSADLGAVMAQTEGVNVQRAGGLGSNTRFSLNGLSGDQIRFFYDGIPLNYTPYAFGIANVPVNMIDRVEIYKGVVPIEFGADALGGAVNLAPPDVYNGLTGSASYQFSSFNTHRVTGNLNYANEKSGLYVVAGGFYDYSDNDYKIDAAIPDERGQLQPVNVKRFHDGYQAYGTNLRVGIRYKKWANELSLEGYYGDYDNEVQNSQAPGLIDYPSLGIEKAVASNPFGEVRFITFSQGLNLHYNVNLGSKWKLDLKAGYNYNERISIDTSHNVYNWYGEVTRVNIAPGEFGDANHLITMSESSFIRQQVFYTFSEKHAIKLSVAPTYVHRTGDDLLVEGRFDPALDNGYLSNLVTGLEYTLNLADDKLQNIAFVKNYRQNIRIESVDSSIEGVKVEERSVSNYGAGTGLRYNWTTRFTTKLSYEYAYRLPRQNEIFGDGQLVTENLALKPESSHNLNAQWNFNSKASSGTEWQLQGNFFLRKIDDLIFLLVNQDDLGSYQNVWSATSQGIELSGRWKDLIPGLTVSANTTYQQYRNTSDEGPFASFKGDRIPNTPYFFANGSAEYQLPHTIKNKGRLSFFWTTRYVRHFYIGWESAGLRELKPQVPNQTLHTVGLTHRIIIKGFQNALTVEVQNLGNAKVYDLYGTQRPGRGFYVKTTLQF